MVVYYIIVFVCSVTLWWFYDWFDLYGLVMLLFGFLCWWVGDLLASDGLALCVLLLDCC